MDHAHHVEMATQDRNVMTLVIQGAPEVNVMQTVRAQCARMGIMGANVANSAMRDAKQTNAIPTEHASPVETDITD